MSDPHGVLGVGRDATDGEIDEAYRRAVLTAWDEDRLREVRQAYAALSPPEPPPAQAEEDGTAPPPEEGWEQAGQLPGLGYREPGPGYDQPQPGDHEPEPGYREPEPLPPPPPKHRSRNPVDRMTEGLPHPWRVAIDWAVTIVGAVAIVLAIKAWVVNPYRIPSSSMEPTLHCAIPGEGCEARFSDRVLANRLVYHFRDPRRGDIIVFNTPPRAAQECGAGGTFVKRLIALPGETWWLQNGVVYINGKRLDEPYILPSRRGTDTQPHRTVPPGRYVFLGDNRTHSCDSRQWGSVPRKNIIGKVFAVYWPPNRISIR